MDGISSLEAAQLPIGTLVQLVFYFVAAAYVIFTAIFYYHWQQYSTNAKITTLTLTLYFVTTIPLVIVMGIMALLII